MDNLLLFNLWVKYINKNNNILKHFKCLKMHSYLDINVMHAHT